MVSAAAMSSGSRGSFIGGFCMKLIPLTKGQFAKVDDADYDELIKTKWHVVASSDGKSFYAARYVRMPDGRNSNETMHRVVMMAKPGEEVDHRFHDTLDNRRSQLRIATHAQNQRNRLLSKYNTSGYKGVSWNRERCKWEVRIRVDGVKKNGGRFDCKLEAARAYDKLSRQYHQDYSLNNADLRAICQKRK